MSSSNKKASLVGKGGVGGSLPSTPSNNNSQSKSNSIQKSKSTPKNIQNPPSNSNSTSPSKKNKASKPASVGKKAESPSQPSQSHQAPPSAQRTPSAKTTTGNENQKKYKKVKGKGVENQQVGTRQEEDKDGMPLHWTAVVDGQIGSIPPLFTRDSDYYFQATSSTVRVHSRATGKVVSTLSIGSDAHTAPITGLVFNPSNSLQLVTSSLDGTLKVWDYLDGVLLRSIWVGLPITQLASSSIVKESSNPSVFVATRKPQSSSSASGKAVDPFNHNGRCNSIVYSVSLTTQKGAGGSVKLSTSSSDSAVQTKRPKFLSRIGKMKETNDLKASADGKWLVAIGNKKIHVINLHDLSSDSNSGFTKIASDEQLTTLAFHPQEPIFATGDSIGKIRIWNFLNDEAFFSSLASSDDNGGGGIERQAPSTVLHWHSHAVSSLTFSPNGAYLASGGEESVLVLWNLNQHNQKEFVPRLGAPIASISVAGATLNQSNGKQSGEIEYVVALKDGSVTFVGSGNLKVSRSFARVKTDASIKPSSQAALSSLPLPLAIQPVTGHLVLPSGHPSTIQFFSLSSDSHVQDLEIASSNRVSRPDETPIEPTRVERVVFSSDAKWMATLDSRQAGVGQMNESALKFWRWNANQGKYLLNSRVEKPHSKGKITSMSFSPSSSNSSIEDDSDHEKDPFFVTTGTDFNTKTWQTSISTMKGGRTEKYWSARSIFKYKTSIPSHAAWSTDSNGSLLAVAHEDVVTLWESSSNSMIQVLSCPEMEQVKTVSFVGKGGRFLAILARDDLVIWDLVMGDLIGSKRLENKVEDLVAGEDGTFMLINRINHRKSRVEVYDPNQTFSSGVLSTSDKYLVPYSLSKVLSFGSSSIPSASSTASTSKEKLSNVPSLLASTSQRSIILLGAVSSNLTKSSGSTSQSLKDVDLTQRSFFDELFGLNESEESSTMNELEIKQKEERENSRSIFVSNAGDARLKEVYKLFDSPSHLLPNLNSLSTSLFQALLPPAKSSVKGSGNLADDLDEEDESEDDGDKMDLDEESEQVKVHQDERIVNEDDEIRMKQIQSQDMSHLTDLFRKSLTTVSTEGKKSTNATPKAKSKPNGISTPASQEAGSAKKKQKSTSSTNTPVRGSGKKGQK